MELIQLIVLIIVIGVLLWLVNNYIPMDDTVKRILNAVVIIALVIWLLFWLLSFTGVNLHTRVGYEIHQTPNAYVSSLPSHVQAAPVRGSSARTVLHRQVQLEV